MLSDGGHITFARPYPFLSCNRHSRTDYCWCSGPGRWSAPQDISRESHCVRSRRALCTRPSGRSRWLFRAIASISCGWKEDFDRLTSWCLRNAHWPGAKQWGLSRGAGHVRTNA